MFYLLNTIHSYNDLFIQNNIPSEKLYILSYNAVNFRQIN